MNVVTMQGADGVELTVEKINPQLYPLLLPIEALKLDGRNARAHGARNLTSICHSFRRYGQQKPIVVIPDGTIAAGNGSFTAVCGMGWKYIAAIVFDGDLRAAREFALADNRSAELAEWDLQVLADELRDLKAISDVSIEDLGWADYEVEPLLAADFSPPAVTDMDNESNKSKGRAIKLSDEQYEVVIRAVNRLREVAGDAAIPEGRAVELIANDYLGRVGGR